MEGPAERDIGFLRGPFGQGLEPDAAEGIFARTGLDVRRGPIEAPVAVGIDVALAVLVDLAVAVVVDALFAEDRPLALLPRPPLLNLTVSFVAICKFSSSLPFTGDHLHQKTMP